MEVTYERDALTIPLSGRITAENVGAEENRIRKEMEPYPDARQFFFDASSLEYISSAGLRFLLTLQKEKETKIHVINVSDEVMDIFETTGFTGLMYVRKPFKEISIEGCQVIGEGAYGTVYRIDEERIVKVYKEGKAENILLNIERDRNLSSELFLHGIPTAIPYDVVRVGTTHGVIYEMLEAKTLLELMNTDSPYLQEMYTDAVLLAKKLHSTRIDDIRLPDGNKYLRDWYNWAVSILCDEAKEKVKQFLDKIPQTHTIIHADFHPGNIMVRDKGPGVKPEVMLIDLGVIKEGHPCTDFISLYPFSRLARGPFANEKFLEDLNRLELDKIDRGLKVNGRQQELDVLAARMEQFWDTFLTTYFKAANEEEKARTEEVLCEFCMMKYFTMAAKKRTSDDELVKWVEDTYLKNIGLLDKLTDLNWNG